MRRYSLMAAAVAVLMTGCCALAAEAGTVPPRISAGGTEHSAAVRGADGSGERKVIVLGRTSAGAATFGITPSAAGTVEHNIWPLPPGDGAGASP